MDFCVYLGTFACSVFVIDCQFLTENFSSMFGVLFGLAMALINSRQINLTESTKIGFKKMRLLFSLFSLNGFIWLALTCESKPDYNKVHPYIALVPVNLLSLRPNLGNVKPSRVTRLG